MGSKKSRKLKLRHLLLVILTIYILSIFINQQGMINKLNAEKKEKETIIQGLRQEINGMEKEKELINSPEHINEYVEKVAREELKMIKPGETIYIDKNKQENGFEDSLGN